MRVLMTGASGKVGAALLPALLRDTRFAGWQVRVFCHNRRVEHPGVEMVMGSLADAAAVAMAMDGVSHVLHLATVKETPAEAMDVGVKGMFHLLEAFRASPAARQFLLMGGDCSVGHIFQPYPGPITEDAPRRAYPGCYALTKVIEEVMLEQYRIQYGIGATCLRAPWIMEKDDFRHALSFSAQFGGPAWTDFLTETQIAQHAADEAVPLLLDGEGYPLRRNFVHLDDLVSAILAALNNPHALGELFNISMNEPVDYGDVAAYLARTRGLPAVRIATPHFSNWLSNAKARLRLGWHPLVEWKALVDRAWAYERAADEPRRVFYPG